MSGVRGAEVGGVCVHGVEREPTREKRVGGHEGIPGAVPWRSGHIAQWELAAGTLCWRR